MLIEGSSAKVKSPQSKINPCFFFWIFFHTLWRNLSFLELEVYTLTKVYVLLLISHTIMMHLPLNSYIDVYLLKGDLSLMAKRTPFDFVPVYALAEKICGHFFILASAVLSFYLFWGLQHTHVF